MTSTAMVTTAQPALAVVRTDPLADAISQFGKTMNLAGALVKSGFLPRAINTPEKAVAVILAGRELGIGPMLALRSISIIDAKPVVAADLQLSRFKADGGRAEFKELSDQRAVLWLRHPNGDEHTETFTHADAQAAQLLGKDNWKKFKKAMLRSRVITAGLKSIGYEPTCGVYDPDEADHFRPAPTRAATVSTTDNGSGTATAESDEYVEAEAVEDEVVDEQMTIETALAMPLPGSPTAWNGKGGTPLGQLDAKMIPAIRKWVNTKIEAAAAEEGGEAPPIHYRLLNACDLIIDMRKGASEKDQTKMDLSGASASAPGGNPTTLKPGKVEDALDWPANHDTPAAPAPAPTSTLVELSTRVAILLRDPKLTPDEKKSFKAKFDHADTADAMEGLRVEIEKFVKEPF